MTEEQRRQLQQQLWNIANTLRGKMNADEFRDYILGFIFYKYLSEKLHLRANAILEGEDVDGFLAIDEESEEGQEMLEALSTVVAGITEIDLWPSFYASCYELRDGAIPVPPGHPQFYANHREVGRFPGLSMVDEKVVLTRVFKALGGFWDPLL